ncbi:MAG: helix-hairpin-helix domain-containing protein [Terracidiphilus sp.]
MKRIGFFILVASLAGLAGCSPNRNPNPDQIRQDTAKATREAARDTKAVVQGVVDGLKKTGPVNINQAPEADLETLPGIDAVRAHRIVANRPYSRSDDLVQRDVITQAEYDRIASQIVTQ